jgi:hypothetical protein
MLLWDLLGMERYFGSSSYAIGGTSGSVVDAKRSSSLDYDTLLPNLIIYVIPASLWKLS